MSPLICSYFVYKFIVCVRKSIFYRFEIENDYESGWIYLVIVMKTDRELQKDVMDELKWEPGIIDDTKIGLL